MVRVSSIFVRKGVFFSEVGIIHMVRSVSGFTADAPAQGSGRRGHAHAAFSLQLVFIADY